MLQEKCMKQYWINDIFICIMNNLNYRKQIKLMTQYFCSFLSFIRGNNIEYFWYHTLGWEIVFIFFSTILIFYFKNDLHHINDIMY